MATNARTVVVDASVVLKWQLDDEEHILQATAMRDDYYVRGAVILIAPQLLVYEVVNGIATATRQKRIPSDKAAAAICNLLALAVELKEVEPLRVLEMALQHKIAAYDAAYLALAEAETCELWTGDKTLYRAASERLPWIKWIGDYVSIGTDD